MFAGLKNDDVLVSDEIHQPISSVDPTRPGTAKYVSQRFWLANARERITHGVRDQGINAAQRLSVFALP